MSRPPPCVRPVMARRRCADSDESASAALRARSARSRRASAAPVAEKPGSVGERQLEVVGGPSSRRRGRPRSRRRGSGAAGRASRVGGLRRRGPSPRRRGRAGGAPRRARRRHGPSASPRSAASASSRAVAGSPWSASNRARSRSTIDAAGLEQRDLGAGEVERCAPRRRRRPRPRASPRAMTYSGSGRIAAARSNCRGAVCEVARRPTASRPRPAIDGAWSGTSARALLVRGLSRPSGSPLCDQQVAEQRGDEGRVLRREAG